MSYLISTMTIGIGATALMDVWGIVRKLLFDIQPPEYRLVGRWLGHMTRGRFVHESIAESRPVRGEIIVGWTAHYLIGISFAAVLVAVWGLAWVRQPTIGPPLVVGIGTVLAPFLLMQPGMGAGIAASRTANPAAARVQSLLTHIVFGLGLYASALVVRRFIL